MYIAYVFIHSIAVSEKGAIIFKERGGIYWRAWRKEREEGEMMQLYYILKNSLWN